MHLLEVKNLRTRFKIDRTVVKAVDGVSYYIDESEIVGLVGESGCGKSVSQLSVLQLIPIPPGEITAGEALLEGRDLLRFEPKGDEMCSVRGGKIIIFTPLRGKSSQPMKRCCAKVVCPGRNLHILSA